MSYLTDDSVAVDDERGRTRSIRSRSLDRGSCPAPSLADRRRVRTQAGRLIAPRSLGTVLDAEDRCTPALIVRPRSPQRWWHRRRAPHPPKRPSSSPTRPSTLRPTARAACAWWPRSAARGRGGHRVRRAPRRGRRDRERPSPSVAVPATSVEDHARPGPSCRVVPDLDVEILGDEALIWHRGRARLHRLSPAATAIWLAAQGSPRSGRHRRCRFIPRARDRMLDHPRTSSTTSRHASTELEGAWLLDP